MLLCNVCAPCDCVFAGANTLHQLQVVGWWWITSGSMSELSNVLDQLNARFASHGIAGIDAFFSDRFDDGTVLVRSFSSLKRAPAHAAVTSAVTLPLLQADISKVHYVHKSSQLRQALQILTNDGKYAGPYAMDCEWEPSRTWGVDVLQLANEDGVVVIVHLSTICAREWKSQQKCSLTGHDAMLLKSVLQSESIKVGVNVNGDKTRLEKCLDVTVNGVVDLSTLAKSANVVTKPRMSLKELVRCLLGKLLPKSSELQLGPWGTYPLSEDMQQYGADDVIACLKVKQHIDERRAPACRDYDPTVCNVGNTVLVCDTQSQSVVAEGTIVQNTPTHNGHFLGVFIETVTDSRVVVQLTKVTRALFLIPLALRYRDSGDTYQPRLSEVETDPVLSGRILVPKSMCRAPLVADSVATVTSVPVTVAVPELSAKEAEELQKDQKFYEGLAGPFGDSLKQALAQLQNNAKGDGFHGLFRIGEKIKKGQPLRPDVLLAFSLAMYEPFEEDVAMVDKYLDELGYTEERLLRLKRLYFKKYYLKFCRRYSGESALRQLRRFLTVALEAKEHVHPVDQEPLLRDEAWKVIENVAVSIARGWYLDPAGVPMYHYVGTSAEGLPVHVSDRGSSRVESYVVHRNEYPL
jgi:hypothetical protein